MEDNRRSIVNRKPRNRLLLNALIYTVTVALALGFAAGCSKGNGQQATDEPSSGDPAATLSPDLIPKDASFDIYPKPKSAEIKDAFYDAGTLNTSGLSEDIAAALSRAGFKTGDSGMKISFENDKKLAAEAYTLKIGDNGISVKSSGRSGALNAVSTLSQLFTNGFLPGAEISDSPDTQIRGVIEGFYGKAWTHAFRLELLEFMGKVKLNTYIYAPKDDEKHRSGWRLKYTEEEIAKMRELVETAVNNNVRFVYAISPGLDINLGNGYEKDLNTLFEKCESLYEIGVRDFSILLDDIPTLNAEGHAKLLNDFQTKFCETHEGVSDLIAITPEFCAAMLTQYTDKIAPLLNKKIVLMWTGAYVLPQTITTSELDSISKKLGRKVLIWWNYPVNDTMGDNLFLGPCAGLSNTLPGSMTGLVSNPMNQGHASLVPVFTIADFLWNAEQFDQEASLSAAARMLEPECADSYKELIDLCRASAINGNRSVFSEREAVRNYRKGTHTAEDIETLAVKFEQLDRAMNELREKGSASLISEINEWIEKADAFAKMGIALFRLEQLTNQGTDSAADKTAEEIAKILELADMYTTASKRSAVNSKIVSPDTLTTLFKNSNRRFNELVAPYNIEFYNKTAETTLATYEDYKVSNAIDGDDSTFFWSSGAPSVGSTFTVDLAAVFNISRVYLNMGVAGHDDDYLRAGVVEYSSDGNKWTALGNLSGRKFSDTTPISARYVRVRCTGAQVYWLIITEFGVEISE
ncbi:MAG: beta-N-acetylglucosaminidase domain-containing protein [Clostridia bacterium]|nr:beta-N-acetylglucosaminidase domain-containing protein [Clostridia bacterium]